MNTYVFGRPVVHRLELLEVRSDRAKPLPGKPNRKWVLRNQPPKSARK